jgi:CRISPR/Cas system-associated exonuclease Cas4 (RecB family)
MLTTESSITGVQVNYYFIFKTKLWYFSHYTTMEHTSDAVLLGKLIHEKNYSGTEGLSIDRINIDFIEKSDQSCTTLYQMAPQSVESSPERLTERRTHRKK